MVKVSGLFRVLPGLLASFLSAGMFAQTTIHVPADQPTIQAGIDAASNGDTVLVAPGTYTGNLDFKGKAITVTSGATSSAGAAATIINGDQQNPAVIFHSGETRASVINGFTIQNGVSGVYLPNSSATISNNVITSNIACGVAATGQSAGPLITGNTISHTRYIYRVECTSPNDPYYNDDESQRDTAIFLFDAGSVDISGNLIEDNGIYAPGSGPLGAGIFSETFQSITTLLITNNVLHDNYADEEGTIDVDFATHITITQNLIYNNLTDQFPVSGIQANVASYSQIPGVVRSLIVTNNTVYANTSKLIADGKALPPGTQGSFDQGPSIVIPFSIENNLFISSDQYGAVSCGAATGSTIVYSNNDIFNASAAQMSTCTGSGTGNLVADPQFLSPGTGNFFTQRTSPVVAAGDVNALSLPATDLAGKNRTVCGTVDMGVYEVHPIPPIALSSSPNPSVGGTPVTLSAVITGNCNIPTGTLTFYDGSTALGTGVLSSAGMTSFSTAALTVGNHTLTATYPGDFNFDPSTSNPVTQVVTGYPTATSLQVAPNPAKAFQSITFSAGVSSQFGVPTGTISFYAGATLLGSGAVNGGGQAAVTVSTLGAGTYAVTAVYNASNLFASSTSPVVSLVVEGASTSTSLNSTPNPSSFGQNVLFTATVSAQQSTAIPTGVVDLMEGAALPATSPLNPSGTAVFNVANLAVGSHTLIASYRGSPNDNVSSSSAIVQNVVAAPVSVSLTSSLNPANLGQSVAFVATVTSGVPSYPLNGTVTFSDQSGALATVALNAGQAVFTTSSLAVGTHSIVATFSSGSANFTGGVSPDLQEVIQRFDFTLSVSSTTLTIPRSGYQVLTVTLTPVGGFNHSVALACASMPVYSQCSFNPAVSGSLGSGPQQVQLVLNTDQIFEFGPRVGALAMPASHGSRNLLVFAALMLPLLAFRPRNRWLATRYRMLALLFSAGVLAGLAGCSGKQPGYTPAGTYTVTVNGTDTGSINPLTHSEEITLHVAP